ncbi:MAG: arylsulfatase [Bacteroidetes bacterium]|nr:arylsulfatase [Fibrella sp.]
MKRLSLLSILLFVGFSGYAQQQATRPNRTSGDAAGSPERFRPAARPNIILIYTDDLGYGDLSCYGATKISTPNIDRLAHGGLRFTRAHATSASCTPSRYALLTGEYPWRRKGTGIAPGDAAAIIEPGRITLPVLLQKAGYQTGVVGKWHLGLGPQGGPDWNGDIKKGPNDIGFDYSFIMPATGDRVPCVFVENQRVVGLDTNDPIRVSFKDPVGDEPTGKNHPEVLKMKPSHGHDFTIINGISRIGYMSGGKGARWTDEDLAQVLTSKAIDFIDKNKTSPFFLYFATHDIHVPRVPNQRFVGKSGLGPRGDVILQLDWTVGEILKTLERLKLTDNTLVMLSSDNGAVVDDGYQDEAVEKLNGHTPSGPLRGGKYSAFEGGTRVPTIVRWPSRVKAGVTDALVSQIDLLASFAKLIGQAVPSGQAPDSQNQLAAWLGETKMNREHVIEHAVSGTLSLVRGNWKYIEPGQGVKLMKNSNTETGADPQPQLYDLTTDLAEQKNVAANQADKVLELKSLLEEIRKGAVAVK